jgi:hydroxymethylpyrimidine pyrophosphatase-like HAD family hydrolase
LLPLRRNQLRVLVSDYDMTLTTGSQLSDEMVEALERFRAAGFKLVLDTGRTLPWLYGPNGIHKREHLMLFDVIVGENGAVIWNPRTEHVRLLGNPPSPQLIKELQDAGVQRITVGLASVHVELADGDKLVPIAKHLGLRLHAIEGTHHKVFVNSWVDKATGMHAALRELGLRPNQAVTIGDGQNDVAMLDGRNSGCGVGVAVHNAVPAAKQVAVVVTAGDAGAGVREIMEAMIRGELRAPQRRGVSRGRGGLAA